MVAKRSKARAHDTAAAKQRSRRTRAEVFDLNDALSYGRLRFAQYVDSRRRWPAVAARCGTGTAPSRRLCRAPWTTSAESPSWWSGGMRAGVDLTAPGGVSAAERMQPPRADPEHLALVLGLLASANKRIT